MMRELIYICGQGHSGSTLLDMVLGGHSKLVGLGEVCKLVQPGELERRAEEGKVCSCGHVVAECSFWGQVLKAFAAHSGISTGDRYRLVIDVFEDIYGNSIVPVDSSKYLPCMKMVSGLGYQLKAVRLTRDVRAYAISYMDNAKKKKLPYIKRLCSYQYYSWYKNNINMDLYFSKNNISVIHIGYEDLCMSIDSTISDICNFVGVKFEEEMKNINNSKSHVLIGNRMRKDTNKRSGISYDYRWFSRNEWLIPALLFPKIMRYNSKHVYGDSSARKWKNT